jgi:hypothetical protein
MSEPQNDNDNDDSIYIVILVFIIDEQIEIETMGTGLNRVDAIEYFVEQFGPVENISNGYVVCKKRIEDGTAYILKANN